MHNSYLASRFWRGWGDYFLLLGAPGGRALLSLLLLAGFLVRVRRLRAASWRPEGAEWGEAFPHLGWFQLPLECV